MGTVIEFLKNNLSTIIVCLILAVITFIVIRRMIKTNKKGGCSCGTDCKSCSSCSSKASCNIKNNNKRG